uniref:Uncharacterized protein n=1 Tax=Utricularia reniformis TaxID=192314 RepID=A0A1Y0B3Z1_9LAMI|nr:hypothetical protein AEK19_MT2015 [Utricularia reniformis]ART32175.1 hypothetical protein AEK19_MT2015 [Utricularia reniformis]
MNLPHPPWAAGGVPFGYDLVLRCSDVCGSLHFPA